MARTHPSEAPPSALLPAAAKDRPEVSSSPPKLLEAREISKRFPGVLALDRVDFSLAHGEVHVLFGENGAGKSTLINVIAGTYPPDAGHLVYEGQELRHLTPHTARSMGISPVFQEFSLVPDLTVEQNLALGREISRLGFLSAKEMRRRAEQVLSELGFDLDPRQTVRALSRAHQQMVEIAKALLNKVRVLILDEPTASLTERETQRLFTLIEQLRQDGVGIVYVSHRIHEIQQLADHTTVLRDGRVIGLCKASEVSEAELVEMMAGRRIELLFPSIVHKPNSVAIQTTKLTASDGRVNDVDFVARAGEITGVAGLVGCGKSELIRAIYGLETISGGNVSVDRRVCDRITPALSLRRGVCYFPADRAAEGLALVRPARENVSLVALGQPPFSKHGLLQRRAELSTVKQAVEKLQLRPPDVERMVAQLSGGNRQKVMLARGLTRDFRVFLFDEPTVGIDVGAKVEVYNFMKTLVEGGAAVVLVSSELPEVLNLANRLYVMHNGHIVAELAEGDINEQNVLARFFGENTRAAAR
jgi:ribose transport system ATP-binding protein